MLDHRDTAKHMQRWIESFDEKTMSVIPVWSEDGAAIDVCYQVCDTCDGKGSHVNPSIDAHGISAEEFAEDPDFAREYFRGRYDMPCNGCGGKRVIPMPVHDADLKALERWQKEEYQYLAECAAERRMGA